MPSKKVLPWALSNCYSRHVEYAVKRSRRAKYIHLRVQPGGVVVVTAPSTMTTNIIEKFLRDKALWLTRAVERMKQFKALPVAGRRDYLEHKETARAFLRGRIDHWNSFYKFSYGRIAVKDTRRLWGSCSHKGNLNFSYKLLFLPRELADYVVVHELCHLKERNHGPRFWALVGVALPDHRERRRELRKYLPHT